jgi:hypothetical protein
LYNGRTAALPHTVYEGLTALNIIQVAVVYFNGKTYYSLILNDYQGERPRPMLMTDTTLEGVLKRAIDHMPD